VRYLLAMVPVVDMPVYLVPLLVGKPAALGLVAWALLPLLMVRLLMVPLAGIAQLQKSTLSPDARTHEHSGSCRELSVEQEQERRQVPRR
jgi:hypothetical protein